MKPEDLELICQIEQKTGLEFQKESNSGNLCFANNNRDLQDDFKQTFTEKDFRDFFNSFEENEIQIPENALDFWKRIKKTQI